MRMIKVESTNDEVASIVGGLAKLCISAESDLIECDSNDDDNSSD